MALPGDLNSVAVTGTFKDASGAAMSGVVSFTPSAILTDATGNVVIPTAAKTFTVSGGSLATTALVATDCAGLLPSGWTYLVTVSLTNLKPYSYNVQLPAAPLAFTATNATPAVFTAAGSAYVNGTAVTLTGGSVPAGFTAGVTYFVVSASGTSFSLATTSGGSAIASTGTGSGFVSTALTDISDLQPVTPQGVPTSYVPTTGGTYTGTVILDGSPALQIPAGGAGGQVLTSDSSGNATWAAPALVVKPSVQEATAAALPANAYVSGVLTASSNGALTVDGIVVSLGDRVLVKNEAAASSNGIYVVTATGSGAARYVLTRASDMNVAADIPGAFAYVEQGTANGATGWMVSSGIGPYTLGSTAINWTQFSAVPAAGLLTPTATKTANYTAAAGDMVKTDTSGGSFTVTLPSAPPVNTTIGVKQIAVAGLGTNATTVACGGSDVLNKSGGPTSMTLDRLNQTVIVQYGSGGIWTVESADPAAGQIATARQGVYYLDSFTGTDDAKMTAAVTALFGASPAGGTIVLSPRAHTFANQWTTSYSAGVATAVKIQGAGVAYNGWWGPPAAATTATFTYSGGGAACMDFQHIGSIEITGIQLKNANTGKPLFQTTNASPNLHDCVFSGGGSGANCTTDAIILGGAGSVYGAGDTAPYQGYQGQIYRNFFDGIRRQVLFQTSSNSVEIHENTSSTSCGSGLLFGGAIEINNTVNNTTGVHVWGNCVEMTSYPVYVRCTSGAELNIFGPNGLYDASVTKAYYYFASNSGNPNSFNTVIDGMRTDSIPLVLDYTGSVNQQTFHQSQFSVETQYQMFNGGKYFFLNPTGMLTYDLAGDYATMYPIADAPGSGGYAGLNLSTGNCTQVTDGATYAGSNWVTSLTAAFTTTDVMFPITTATFPAAVYIAQTATPTTAFPWVASSAYVLGDIVRPTSSNSHLYQATTGGTSASSQPTWPTGGGTVTDGSVVWTDLGTSATAAFASKAANSTGTGLTTKWGRLAQAQRLLAQFLRYHFISQGSAPSGGADAGAGTSPSGISTTGTDHAFTFNITTGTSTASGDMFHVNPAQSWGGNTPNFNVTAGNAATASLLAGGWYYTNTSGILTFFAVNAPAASTAYVFRVIALV